MKIKGYQPDSMRKESPLTVYLHQPEITKNQLKIFYTNTKYQNHFRWIHNFWAVKLQHPINHQEFLQKLTLNAQ